MARRVTAHDLADYARCPRAWWYEHYHAPAHLDAAALTARLEERRRALGRRAGRDPEIQVLIRLLERQERFAGGRAAHASDAGRHAARSRTLGCLPAFAVLAALTLTTIVTLWH